MSSCKSRDIAGSIPFILRRHETRVKPTIKSPEFNQELKTTGNRKDIYRGILPATFISVTSRFCEVQNTHPYFKKYSGRLKLFSHLLLHACMHASCLLPPAKGRRLLICFSSSINSGACTIRQTKKL